MTPAPRRRVRTLPVFLTVSAISATAALVLASERAVATRANSVPRAPVEIARQASAPIASEAGVFATRAGMLAIEPGDRPRRPAHPRTLATHRSLRAYPGAPPRIPHGLTPAEFQSGGCRTCHERGGFSQRFGAYVPLTPHPEMGACLQCHVGDAELMALPLPGIDPNARCGQCHARGGASPRWTDSTVDWRPLRWPVLAAATRDLPPAIPHALEMRTNCLTCHSPPSAVAEIRTTHPERVSCRQCHVTAAPAAGQP